MFETATFQTPKAQPSQSTQCAASGSRGWRVLLGLLAMLALLLPMAQKAQAQTGHFTYQAMAGSGFNNAATVAFDGKGDIFVADYASTSVFEVVAVNGAVSTSSAVITVGSGFLQPVSVAVDGKGDVFVADFSKEGVYEIVADSSGNVSGKSQVNTLATGFATISGVAVDGSGNVYISDTTSSGVYKLTAVSGVVPNNSSSTTVATGLVRPSRLAVDGNGNIFVATEGAVVEIPGGSGTPVALPAPTGGWGVLSDVAVDASGNVFASDSGNKTVYEYLATGGAVSSSTAIGTVAILSTRINGLAVDNSGNIALALYSSTTVGEISRQAVNMGTVNVNAPSSSYTLTFTFDTGGYIGAPVVLTQGATGKDFTDAGGGSCTTTNGASNLYAEYATCTINVKFTPRFAGLRTGALEMTDFNGNPIATLWLRGVGQGEMVSVDPAVSTKYATNTIPNSTNLTPEAIAVDAAGDLFAAGDGWGQLMELAKGQTTWTGLGSTSNFAALAIDGKGNLYLADNNRQTVYQLPNTNTSGSYTSPGTGYIDLADPSIAFGGQKLSSPSALAVGPDGTLYIADFVSGSNGPSRVVTYNLQTGATGVRVASGLLGPFGLAVDASGTLYVADAFAGKVMVYAGSTLTSALTIPNAASPYGIAIEPSGSLLVSDMGTGNIVRVPNENGVLTVADAVTIETAGGSGYGMALDATGNLYMTDGSQKAVYAYQRTQGTLGFGAVSDGSSATQTLMIQNAGNVDLTGWTTSGGPMAPFANTYSPNGCANLLPAGYGCAPVYLFSPTSPETGPQSNPFTIVDSSSAPLASVTLNGAAQQPQMSAPVFSLAGSTFAVATNITISDSTPAATIYYTTDGVTTPTTGSPSCTSPCTVLVSTTETIQAIAAAAGYSASTVTSATYTINPSATAIALLLSANPASSTVGAAVNLTASTSTAATAGEPVTFYNGTAVLGQGTIGAAGAASFSTSALPLGVNQLTAYYAGDAGNLSSTSNTLPYSVGNATTTQLSLSSTVGTITTPLASGSSLAAGTPLTLTAAVSSGSPVTVGQVNFCYAGTTCTDINKLGTAQLLAPNGTASISFYPGVGNHSYSAMFVGTPNTSATPNGPSSSTSASLTVTGATTTSIGDSVFHAGPVTSYTVTATVTATGSSAIPLSGSVTFPNTSNGNALMGTVALTASTSPLTFLNPNTTDPAVGAQPQSVAVADFDGDGIPDMVVVNYLSYGTVTNTVTVFKGAGNGTFTQVGAALTTDLAPRKVVVGDFNNDGSPDFAVVTQDGVDIFLNNGSGKFKKSSFINLSTLLGSGFNSIAAGDFNGDGQMDLAVTHSASSPQAVVILLGNGDGTFTEQTNQCSLLNNDLPSQAGCPAVGGESSAIEVGDFNEDGIPDLAVADITNGKVDILLGNGDGTFAAATAFAVGNYPQSIAVGRFNGDTHLDLAVANNIDGTVTILQGSGAGSFAPASYSPLNVGGNPTSVAAGDFNADGIPDLAVSTAVSSGPPANTWSYEVVALAGATGAGFTALPASPLMQNAYPQAVAVADFNNDGLSDLVTVNMDGTATVQLAQLTQTATASASDDSALIGGVNLVEASYPFTSPYQASTSGTVSLDMTYPTTLALVASPTLTNAGQTVTLTATLGLGESALSPLVNGGFETGDFTGWNSDGSESVNLGSAHSGNYDVSFGAEGSYGTISQALATQPGAAYTVSFWLENQAGSGTGCDFQVLWNGVLLPGGDFSGCTAFGYTQYTFAVTGTGSDTLSFAGRNDPSYYLLDDVSVVNATAMLPTTGELVSFFDNGSLTPLGTAALNASGVATLQTTTLPVGSNNLTATYAGDSSFTASATAPFPVTVAGAPFQIEMSPFSTPQTAAINTAFAYPLEVIVTDLNGNAVPGDTVTFTVQPASGASAVLSSSSASTGSASLPGIAWVTATANGSVGSYTVTASAAGIPQPVTFNLSNVLAPVYTVTTLNDDPIGIPANCTNQVLSGAALDKNCSLRDALAAATPSNGPAPDAAAGGSPKPAVSFRFPGASSIAATVNFASSLGFGTGNSQSLTPSASTPGIINIDTGGTLHVNANMNIQGPGANLLSVASANLNRIFYVDVESGPEPEPDGAGATAKANAGATAKAKAGATARANASANVEIGPASGMVTISGLTITGGSYNEGSGLKNFSTLAINSCTISNNTATRYSGGGIHNAGVLTVTNSTISGNSANNNGGGILNYGTLTVSNSTISGNTAINSGGGFYNTSDDGPGVATLINTTFSGNQDGGFGSAGAYNDTTLTLANNLIADSVAGDVTPTDNGGNVVVNGSVAATDISLAPLGYYGGPTQTMPPLPGSLGICAGLVANVANIATATDQRSTGFPRGSSLYTGYSVLAPCVNAGAVQTNYALAFSTQPPSTVRINAAFAPQVTLTESGSTATYVNSPVTVSGSPAALTGTTTATLSSGVASFSGLSVSTAQSGEVLTAVLGLNNPTSTALNLIAPSNPFDVTSITLPPTTLANGTVGVAYSVAINLAVGGTGAITYTATGMPGWLTLNPSTGVLSGIPTGANNIAYLFTITATDSSNDSASEQYALIIGHPAIVLTPAILSGTYGTAYNQKISASGGIGPYTYALASGSSLPAGLSLSSSGAITGMPAAPSATAYSFTITATDTGSTSNGSPSTGSQEFSMTIARAPLTVTANSATMGYGGPLPALSGKLTGVVNNDNITANYTTTATASSAVGAYPITATLAGASQANYTLTNTPGTLTVTQAMPAIVITSSATALFTTNPVTLTATVSSPAGTPTGTVTFLDGSTPLGTGRLASGVASLTTSTLAMGGNSITASYSGDTNFSNGASGALSETVADFTITASGAIVTALPGSSHQFTFTVSPANGASTMPSAIVLSISGLPAGATAVFSPATIPAGAGATTVTLTIQLPQSTAAAQTGGNPAGIFASRVAPLSLALLLLPFAAGMRRAGKRMSRLLSVILLLGAGMVAIAGLSGCNSTVGFFGQAPKTYTVTVAGTSGSLSHSTTVTLTVE
jgi:sugar lactone lactonase YvrE